MHERDILEDHLRLATLRALEAEEIVAKQLRVICELEASGHDTTAARELLATCEKNLRLHEGDCERLREDLEKLK
jgi:hypothetical protein